MEAFLYNGITTGRITIKYKSLAILEMMIAKGFRQGFTMTLDYLKKFMATFPKKCSKSLKDFHNALKK